MREHLFGEISVLQKMWHKNIMTFFCWWFSPDTNVINFITEMFSSGTLRQYRKRCRHVSETVIKRWAWQICEGLVYLHGHSPPIVHRDLKCDNIFINGCTGQVKIGDLGLATAQRGLSVVGTPEFMAPEVYEEQYDEKVDIYSFGMCLLELATCEYPYRECRNLAQIYRKVTKGIPPEALSRVESEPLQQLIRLCTQLEPSMRPSARKLLKHPFFDSLRGGQPACVYTPYDMTCRSPSGNVRQVVTCGALYATAAAAAANGTSTAAYLSSLSSPIAASGGGGTTPASMPTTATSFATATGVFNATAHAQAAAAVSQTAVAAPPPPPPPPPLSMPSWLGASPVGGLLAGAEGAAANGAAAEAAVRVTQVTFGNAGGASPSSSSPTAAAAASAAAASLGSQAAACGGGKTPAALMSAASAPSFSFSPPLAQSPLAAAAAAGLWCTFSAPLGGGGCCEPESGRGSGGAAAPLGSTSASVAGMTTTTCSDSAGLVWARAGHHLLQNVDSLDLGWLEGSSGGNAGHPRLEEDMSLQCDLAAVGRHKVEVPLDAEDLNLMLGDGDGNCGGGGGGSDDGAGSSESSEEVILPLEFLQEEEDGDVDLQGSASFALAHSSSGRMPAAANALSFRLGWLSPKGGSATSDTLLPASAMDQTSSSTRWSSMSCSTLRYRPTDVMSNSGSSSVTGGAGPSTLTRAGSQGVWGVQPAVYGIITRLKKSHPLLMAQDGNAGTDRTHSM